MTHYSLGRYSEKLKELSSTLHIYSPISPYFGVYSGCKPALSLFWFSLNCFQRRTSCLYPVGAAGGAHYQLIDYLYFLRSV